MTTYSWTTAVLGAAWDAASSWTPNGVPMAGDTAVVTSGVVSLTGLTLTGETIDFVSGFGTVEAVISGVSDLASVISISGAGRNTTFASGVITNDGTIDVTAATVASIALYQPNGRSDGNLSNVGLLQVDGGSLLLLNGMLTSQLVNYGTTDATGIGSMLSLQTPARNQRLIEAVNGGTVVVANLLQNNATLLASGTVRSVGSGTVVHSVMAVDSEISGAGIIEIASGGDVVLRTGTIDATQTIEFMDGGGTLDLSGAFDGATPSAPQHSFFAKIDHFQAGDTIVLGTLSAAGTFGYGFSVTGASSGVFEVDLGSVSTRFGSLTFTNFASSFFAYGRQSFISMGAKYYLVACFLEGTLIATTQGPRPVEELRPGDGIVTQGLIPSL